MCLVIYQRSSGLTGKKIQCKGQHETLTSLKTLKQTKELIRTPKTRLVGKTLEETSGMTQEQINASLWETFNKLQAYSLQI